MSKITNFFTDKIFPLLKMKYVYLQYLLVEIKIYMEYSVFTDTG